jgi:hypothetical protein
MLNIKDHISEIISISNLQFTPYFIENTHIINYIPNPKIYNIGLLNSFLIGLVIGKLWLYYNKSSIAKFIINNVNIYILKYISRRILNISLFWKLFIFLLCVFIVIDIYQILCYNNISFNSNIAKIVLNMVDNDKNSVVDASNSVINVQNPIANVSVPVEAAKIVSTSFSTAAGMKAGLELAKSIPSIGGKAAVVIGTSLAAQAINITANKILNTSSSSDTKNSFIPSQFINEIINNSKMNEKYSEYPYNLIPDLNMYVNIEIWFLIILINVLLTAYLLEKKIEINKFIKNDRLIKLLNYMYKRYISVWSVSRNLIIIWCILMLFLCIFMSKLILFILLSQ